MGLSTDKGLLCVMAGAKGLRKIVQTVLGLHAVVQCCQRNKRKSILLPWKREPQGPSP